MSTLTAKRRRTQARNGYRHLAPLIRPHFVKRDAGKSAEREQRKAMRERERLQRKKK